MNEGQNGGTSFVVGNPVNFDSQNLQGGGQ